MIAGELEANGEVCALGCVGRARGIAMTEVDPHDSEAVAQMFGVAPALVREIEYVNDEYGWDQTTPEKRWELVRRWVTEQIKL